MASAVTHVAQMDAPNPQLVWDTLNAYQRTAALRAAIDLDLFTAISEGPNTLWDLAKRCEASARGIRILCDYLTVISFLTKTANTYSLTPTSAVFLDRHSPACMSAMVRFLNGPKLMAGFDNLAATVRRGGTQLPQCGCNAAEYDGWVTFAECMAPMMQAASEFVAEEVARNTGSAPLRVLDIAAGHGLFGIAVARRLPQAEIVGQDWANVLVSTRRNAHSAGISTRYSELSGDVFAVDLGSGYDVVLLMNLLHHFDRPACVSLLKKIHASLAPEGRLITLEFVPNEDRITPPIPATFSLMMLGLTPGGDAYTASEHQDMLRDAGFSASRLVPVPQSPQHLIVSEK
jgi:ubiquinone/menaquinone biosynthesis C-methylase UbiE